jgi:hypothetical protein
VAVDAIGFRDLHLARQFFTGSKTAVGNAALDAVGNLAPQRHAGCNVGHGHRAKSRTQVGKIIGLSRKLHAASLSELSSSIDNLEPARLRWAQR